MNLIFEGILKIAETLSYILSIRRNMRRLQDLYFYLEGEVSELRRGMTELRFESREQNRSIADHESRLKRIENFLDVSPKVKRSRRRAKN